MSRSFLAVVNKKWNSRPKHLVKTYMENALNVLVNRAERFDETEQKNYRWSYKELLRIIKEKTAGRKQGTPFDADLMVYETALYVQEITFLLPMWVDYYLCKSRRCPRLRVSDCIIVYGHSSLMQGLNDLSDKLEDGEDCTMPSENALRFFARSLRFLKAALECIGPTIAISHCDRAFRKFTDAFDHFSRKPNDAKLRREFVANLKEFLASTEAVRDFYSELEAALAQRKNNPALPSTQERKAVTKPSRSRGVKFSQKEMAERLHVSEDTIARWDKGESSPPAGYSRELRERGTLEQLGKFFKEYDGRLRAKDAWNSKHLVRNMSEEQMHRESLK